MADRLNWTRSIIQSVVAVICCFTSVEAYAGIFDVTAESIHAMSSASFDDRMLRLVADATAPGVPTTAEVVTIEKSMAILNTLCHVADPIISPQTPPGRVEGVVNGLKADEVQEWFKNVPDGEKIARHVAGALCPIRRPHRRYQV